MLTKDYRFARDGIYPEFYPAGSDDLPLDVVAQAKKDGVWQAAEKPSEPAEKPAAKRATKAVAPKENK